MVLVNNAPLSNGPENLPSMPLTPENPPSMEGGIYAMPEPAMVSVDQQKQLDKQHLAEAEVALVQAEAPLSPEDQFVGEIYKLIIEDEFFARLQEESKQNFLNDFNAFVKDQIISKKIDKNLDQRQISELLFELYFPYSKKISWAHLQQDAFNDAEKLMDFLKDK